MRPSTDPFDQPPWAMQLVVRVEKAVVPAGGRPPAPPAPPGGGPPAHGAVCAAAATAVVTLLTDPRAADPEGEWHPSVARWEAGRIRKVARRARGARWADVQRLPGVTVDVQGAQVRAFVPGAVDEVPPEIAKLQVAGLDLPGEDEPKPPPEPPYAAIALNPDAAMSTGKAAAQSGHAAHLLLRQAPPPQAHAWIEGGLRVHIVPVRPEGRPAVEGGAEKVPWRRCVEHATVAVRDAGFTEVPPGTMTAAGWIVA
ncbi:peptidyl-tRNA hydrolase [Actinomadura sp. NBRC 104425]|uniref:peptidyl-tRNA hydrolase n=1 Tax=Actinomadura sp. NBRC 104425 TaxID=3032204 RepID=UPI0025569CB0|nr:peptidyl-tRNA hydrolase [Actinomadura sp. NBRC 104425]